MNFVYYANRFLSKCNYNNRITRVPGLPRIFGIETTNVCNLKCTMCPRTEMTRKRGFMDIALFSSIVDQTCKVNNCVRLHEMGEPLLDKNIFAFIDYCSRKGVETEISTNATLLSEAAAKKILDSRLDNIILCLDGSTKEVYEKIRGKANFEETKENIKKFLQLKKTSGKQKPKVHLQIIAMKETEKEIGEFVDYWNRFDPDDVVVKNFSTFSNQVESIKELSELRHRYKKQVVKDRPPCYYLWDSVVVLQDGKVVPCCRDFDASYVLGNARKESIRSIWNGKRLRLLRKRQINGDFDIPLCRDCVEWPDEPYGRFYPFNKAFSKTILRKTVRWMER